MSLKEKINVYARKDFIGMRKSRRAKEYVFQMNIQQAICSLVVTVSVQMSVDGIMFRKNVLQLIVEK